MQQSYAKVKRERDDLQDKFMAAILEVQQKANLKQLVLQKKLEAMQKDVSEKDHQIQELTSNQSLQATAGMDSSSNSSNVIDCSIYCIFVHIFIFYSLFLYYSWTTSNGLAPLSP